MSYVNIKELLKAGVRDNACALAFNACDINTIAGVVLGAEKAKKPVIVMLYPGMRNVTPLDVFVKTVHYYAKQVSVPVSVHLDHCSDYDLILHAIAAGFDSVMADGSVLPFDENVAFAQSIVKVAHNFGVTVEAEVGHVGQASEGDEFSRKESFTRVDEVKKYVDLTGVDSLAVSFGSAHGLYKYPPKLDIDHLKELNAATDVPLVLHGGTGIPDEQLADAFANGINKINIGTEYLNLNTSLNKEFYAKEDANVLASPGFIQPPLIDYIAKRLDLSLIKV